MSKMKLRKKPVKNPDWESSLTHIQNIVTQFNPEDFLSCDKKKSKTALNLLKSLYDFTKSPLTPAAESSCNFFNFSQLVQGSKSKKKNQKQKHVISKVEFPLNQLLIDDFDETQVWEEIELQNNILHDGLVSAVSKILAKHSSPDVNNDAEDDDELIGSYNEIETVDNIGNVSEKKKAKSGNKPDRRKAYPTSIVDDKFFNLAQMTEFLEKVESKIASKDNNDLNPLKSRNNDDSDTGSDDSIDLFEDIDEDREEDEIEDDENVDEKSKNVYYNEFFDQPLDDLTNVENSTKKVEESDEEEEDEEDLEDGDEYKTSLKEDMDGGDDEEDDEEEDDDEIDNLEDLIKNKPSEIVTDKETTVEENMSNFEKRRKKIEESIDMIEEEALKPKAWHLQGEVTALTRPENSLLEEHLIYDHLIREAPEVTAETTKRLEDIIKQRIKDLAWDDVQRKIKPIENAAEYKKKLVLDAEKSKMSLTQIYEQEYIQKKKSENGESEQNEEPEEHRKIKQDMDRLFAQLDALTNFHFAPAKPSVDIKVVTNVPAITIEESAPVNINNATLLAPQEIHEPIKGVLKGKAERSTADKNRERRGKKKKQKLKRIAQEEKARLKGLGLRNVKFAENIVKAKLKSKTEDDAGKIHQKELKSSKAFFSKLQEQVKTQIKDHLTKKRKTEQKQLSAKKFKL